MVKMNDMTAGPLTDWSKDIHRTAAVDAVVFLKKKYWKSRLFLASCRMCGHASICHLRKHEQPVRTTRCPSEEQDVVYFIKIGFI